MSNDKPYQENLLWTIVYQATALAEGSTKGSRYIAAQELAKNALIFANQINDDRINT